MRPNTQLDSIERKLVSFGLRTSRSTHVSTGEWSADDAIWNYLDVPHLNYVHSAVDGIELFADEFSTSSLLVQKAFGFKALGVMSQTFREKNSFLYAGTVAMFTIVVETTISENYDESGLKCASAETIYMVVSGKLLRPLHALVHRVLSRNYAVLMSEDLPMREHRGRLRQSGFNFLRDGKYGYKQSKMIAETNVGWPDKFTEIVICPEDLSAEWLILKEEAVNLLAVRKIDETIEAVSLICSHEGGPICFVDGNPKCSWHGRTAKAFQTRIDELKLGEGDKIRIDLRKPEILFENGGTK